MNHAVALGAWLDVGERHFPLVGKTFSLFLFRMERITATHGFSCALSEAAHAEMLPVWEGASLGVFELKGFEGQHHLFGW